MYIWVKCVYCCLYIVNVSYLIACTAMAQSLVPKNFTISTLVYMICDNKEIWFDLMLQLEKLHAKNNNIEHSFLVEENYNAVWFTYYFFEYLLTKMQPLSKKLSQFLFQICCTTYTFKINCKQQLSKNINLYYKTFQKIFSKQIQY